MVNPRAEGLLHAPRHGIGKSIENMTPTTEEIEGDGRHGSWLGESNNDDIEESDDEEEKEERGEGDMQVDAEVEEEGQNAHFVNSLPELGVTGIVEPITERVDPPIIDNSRVAISRTTSSPFGFMSFPARSTGATMEKDSDYVVIPHEDGSVTLRSGFVEVVVALNFFEGVGDQCTSRMFHILCLRPSTFVGIGEMSSFSRNYVTKSFGQYLEGLNSIKLSTANSVDLRLLQSHLEAIASYGLKVGWLMERARSMEAQIASAHAHRELERVRDGERWRLHCLI